MSKHRVTAVAVVVLLIAAAGVLGLRSWVGIEAGEDLASNDSTSTSAPSASASPGSQETPAPESSPSPTSSETPAPEPTPDEQRERDDVSLASPSGIASDIQARLDQSGPRTSVTCPQAVSTQVGTSFSCAVAYADMPHETVAEAQVNIVGSGLRYVWRSVPR